MELSDNEIRLQRFLQGRSIFKRITSGIEEGEINWADSSRKLTVKLAAILRIFIVCCDKIEDFFPP